MNPKNPRWRGQYTRTNRASMVATDRATRLTPSLSVSEPNTPTGCDATCAAETAERAAASRPIRAGSARSTRSAAPSGTRCARLAVSSSVPW